MVSESGPESIVFFDGECAMCDRSVRFYLEHDRRGTMLFAPIGGRTWRDRMRGRETPDSVVVLKPTGALLLRSDAVVHLLRQLGGGWGMLGGLLAAVPRPLRDKGYRVVARLRKLVYTGSERSCALLPPEKRARILD